MATEGQIPVNLCTCAASSNFSNGSRGTPSCWNTLKRVPESPYPHEGVSTLSDFNFSFASESRFPCLFAALQTKHRHGQSSCTFILSI